MAEVITKISNLPVIGAPNAGQNTAVSMYGHYVKLANKVNDYSNIVTAWKAKDYGWNAMFPVDFGLGPYSPKIHDYDSVYNHYKDDRDSMLLITRDWKDVAAHTFIHHKAQVKAIKASGEDSFTYPDYQTFQEFLDDQWFLNMVIDLNNKVRALAPKNQISYEQLVSRPQEVLATLCFWARPHVAFPLQNDLIEHVVQESGVRNFREVAVGATDSVGVWTTVMTSEQGLWLDNWVVENDIYR